MDLFSALKPRTIIFIGLILLTLFLLFLKLTAKPGLGPVKPQTIHFPLPESASPASTATPAAEQGDPTYYEEIGQKLSRRFPLYRFLPWETKNYTVKYLGPLRLEIDLKTASPSAKTEALEWIESKGVATQSHEIIYK